MKTFGAGEATVRRRSIVAFVLCSAVYAVVNNLYGASYVLLMRERGLGPSRIGQALFISVLVLTVCDYPSGTVADRFGRRTTLGAGFVVWGVALIAFGRAHSFAAVVAAVAIWAVALALISGTATSWLVDQLRSVGDDSTHRRVLPRTGGACLLIGAAAANAGSVLVAWAGLGAPVAAAGGLAVLAGTLILVLMPENSGAAGESLARALRESTVRVLKGPLRRLVMVNFAANVPVGVFLVTWQLDATDRGGLPAESLGPIFSGLMLAMAFGNIAAGSLLARTTSRRVAMTGCAVLIAGCAGAVVAGGAVVLIAALVGVEIGLGVFTGAMAPWVQDLAENEHRAAMTSAVLAAGSAAMIVTAPAVGFLFEQAGPRPAWGLAVGGSMAALGLMIGWTEQAS